jgi:tetratricopeptide (TPR) repeat protein
MFPVQDQASEVVMVATGYRRSRVAAGLFCLLTAVHARTVVAVPKPKPVAQTDADVVARQALAYYNAGQFALAAELYRRAFQLEPSRPAYLYGVGKSERKAGHLEQALIAFRQMLALLPATDDLYVKSKHEVEEIEAQLAHKPEPPPAKPATPPVTENPPAPKEPVSQPKPAVVQPVPAEVRHVPPAVASKETVTRHEKVPAGMPASARNAFLVAGVAAVACAGLAGAAAWQAHQLDDGLRDPNDPNVFDKSRVTSAEVSGKVATYNRLLTGTYIAGAAAVLAGGLGAYWLSKGNERVTVAPTFNGVLLSARF